MPGGGVLLSQTGWRGRNEDGSEVNATWQADTNVLWDQAVDTPFRFRFLIHRELQLVQATGYLQLDVSHNEGEFVLCSSTDGTVVQDVASTNITQGDDTTQQIGFGDFDATFNNGQIEGDGSAWQENTTWSAGGPFEMEMEFALQIMGDQVSPGDTLEFRVRFLGEALIAGYDEIPILVVPEPIVAGVDNALKIKGSSLQLKGSSLIIK
jgi:hypothetical protein